MSYFLFNMYTPFIISLCFEENDDTEDSLPHAFFPHHMYFPTMFVFSPCQSPYILSFRSWQLNLLVWCDPHLLINMPHLGHPSKSYLSFKAQFKSLFLWLRLSRSCPRLLLLKPTNSDNEGSVKTWNAMQEGGIP